jgi:WXG100 family type VII secretion target
MEVEPAVIKTSYDPFGSFGKNIIGDLVLGSDAMIKVAPEALITTSDHVLTKINAAENAFSDMREIMRRTLFYWKGDAGDRHRELFEEETPEMEEIFKRFREHAGDLKTIAANYTNAENAAKAAAEVLSSDVIF